jgi:hypothetical protein
MIKGKSLEKSRLFSVDKVEAATPKRCCGNRITSSAIASGFTQSSKWFPALKLLSKIPLPMAGFFHSFERAIF